MEFKHRPQGPYVTRNPDSRVPLRGWLMVQC
jgi:hypothetical protein